MKEIKRFETAQDAVGELEREINKEVKRLGLDASAILSRDEDTLTVSFDGEAAGVSTIIAMPYKSDDKILEMLQRTVMGVPELTTLAAVIAERTYDEVRGHSSLQER